MGEHGPRAPDLAAVWTPSIYQIPKYLLDFLTILMLFMLKREKLVIQNPSQSFFYLFFFLLHPRTP